MAVSIFAASFRRPSLIILSVQNRPLPTILTIGSPEFAKVEGDELSARPSLFKTAAEAAGKYWQLSEYRTAPDAAPDPISR
jgi:hypothetical protein